MSKYKYFNSFVLIIFLYSGLIKWINIGIDITLASLIVLIAITLFNIKRKIKVIGPEIKIIIIFGVLYSLTSIYTVSDSYFIEKILYLWMAIFSFILPSLILKEEEEMSIFFNVYNFFGIICLLILSYLLLTGQWYIFITSTYDNINFPNYLAVGSFLGVFVLANIKRKNKIFRIISVIAIIFMILLSGRGPVIALLFSYILYFLFSSGKIKQLVPFIIVLTVMYSAYLQFDEFEEVTNSFNRFTNLLGNEERIGQIKEASEIISNNFIFGVGIGGYGIASAGIDAFWHPHNIILEILSESGVFIFTIFLYFLFKIFFINNYKFLLNKISVIFPLIAFFLFIQAMKSGGIADFRITFFWLGMMTYAVKKFKNNNLTFLN